MDRFDETISDESQASQLLQAVLRRPDAVAAPSSPAVAPPPLRQGHDESQSTNNSLPEYSVRKSIPQYHFHGLASTQTQSQHERVVLDEDIQMHDAPGLELVQPDRTSPALCKDMSSKTQSIGYSEFDASRVVAHATKSTTAREIPELPPTDLRPLHPTKSLKAVSFVSPITATGSLPHLRTSAKAHMNSPPPRQRQRSLSPPSQDSFAGPLPYQAAEKRYMESSETFQIPLSELGRSQDSNTASGSLKRPVGFVPASTVSASHQQSRRVSPPRSTRPSMQGNVYVDGTPSVSSGTDSQGQTQQSQVLSVSQFSQLYPQAQPQTFDSSYDHDAGNTTEEGEHVGYQSTEPSSSYERLLKGAFDSDHEPDPELISTQLTQSTSPPLEYQATQPSEFVPSSVLNTGGLATYSVENTQQPTAAPATTSNSNTGPPSILSMVNPAKKWRLRGYVPAVPASAPRSESQVDDSMAASTSRDAHVYQETQPSETREEDSARPLSPLPPSSPPPVLPFQRQPTIAKSPDISGPEIVPDSEATQGDTNDGARSSPAPPTPRKDTERIVTVPNDGARSSSTPTPRKDIERNVPVPRPEKAAAGPSTGVDSGQASDSMLQDKDDTEDEAEEAEEVRPQARKEEEEESDEDEDDDMPLAAASKRRGKGTLGAQARASSKQDKSSEQMPPPSYKGKDANSTPAKASDRIQTTKVVPAQSNARGSWETGVIPSSNPLSNPEERLANVPAPAKDARTTIKRKSKSTTAANTKASSVKTRAMSTPTVKPSRRVCTPESDGETAVSGDALTIPDHATELADDEYMDVDPDPPEDLAPKASTSKKRKRATPSATKSSSKVATRLAKASSATPSAHPAKRSKSASVSRNDSLSATRVFALWRADGHYYSGTVHSLSDASASRYVIHFDDETKDTVDVQRLRRCELKKGDNVLIASHDKAIVLDPAYPGADDIVNVGIDQGNELEKMDVRLQDIRIASRTVISDQWNDRVLTAGEIIPVIRPKSTKVSASPSNLSTRSGGSTKNCRKTLAKTGLVVTLGPGNEHWAKEKEKLMQSIKTNGGTVIDDWSTIFKMDGTMIGKRWILRRDEIAFLKHDIDRVFLLSDDANQKPKFLIALALGIPCLSFDWLNDCIEEQTNKPWPPYLLPAGFCETLSARVSQVVDLDWGNSPQYLREIMDNPVPPRLFSGLSILCIWPDFVPNPKTSRRNNADSDKAREATRMVPKIILCMGAVYVEAVAEAKQASKGLDKFDYVVVKDLCDVERIAGKGVNCVHLGWVKDCLIAGRLLPRA